MTRKERKTRKQVRRTSVLTLARRRLHCIHVLRHGRLDQLGSHELAGNAIGDLVVVPGKSVRQANVTSGIELSKGCPETLTVLLEMRKHPLLAEDRDEAAEAPSLSLLENHSFFRPNG